MTESIVLKTCRDHLVIPALFFNEEVRERRVVACRVDAIHRLREAGFSQIATARVMRCHYDTVRYWLNPGLRARKMASARRRAATAKKAVQ